MSGSESEFSQREVERVSAALRTAIRLSSVSYRNIERRLNMSTGYLTRILTGKVHLRVLHVISVCSVIGLPAGQFFLALFPARATASNPLAKGLMNLHPGPGRGGDLEGLIRDLRECLEHLENSCRAGRIAESPEDESAR